MARKSYSAITLGAFHGRVMRCFSTPQGTKVRGKKQDKICLAAARGKNAKSLSTRTVTVEPYTTRSGKKVKGGRRRAGWVVASSMPKGMKKPPRGRAKLSGAARNSSHKSKFATAARRCGRRGLTRREFNSCVKSVMKTGKLSALANKYVQHAKTKSKGKRKGSRSRAMSGLGRRKGGGRKRAASKRKPKCLKWGKPARKGGKRRCLRRAKGR